MNWLKFKIIYLGISSVLVVGSIVALAVWKLKPAIDFTGGSLMELEISTEIDEEKISEVYEMSTSTRPSVITMANDKKIIIKSAELTNIQSVEIKNRLASISGEAVEIARFESIGPILGRELLIKTVAALTIAALVIMIYVAFVFKNYIYGASAIIAMFHDTIIVLGAFALFGKLWNVEIDSLYVTAVLTTLSFSVHDTVVVYDRIRESLKKYPGTDLTELANKAITETMPRSLNNSMTIVFMLTTLLLIGGSTVYWMSAALLIGTVSGTYSSPFVAVPILVTWSKWSGRRSVHRSVK